MITPPLLKWLTGILLLLLALLAGPAYVALSGQVDLSANWSNSDRSSAGLAPAPSEHREAVLQPHWWRLTGNFNNSVTIRGAGSCKLHSNFGVYWEPS